MDMIPAPEFRKSPHTRGLDSGDPICHDIKEGELARRAFVKRHVKWLDLQPEDARGLYCEHGRYVGRGGQLDHLCLWCPPRD